MPNSMCVAWFSPTFILSRMTAHDASFDTTEVMPNFLKKPSSWAITIGAQSVSAIMPNRTVVVSGPSAAYTPPAQCRGSPAISAPTAPAAPFTNVRRFISPPGPASLPIGEQHVRDHHVRSAVVVPRRGVREKRSCEDVRVSAGDLDLRRQRALYLHVQLLTHVCTRPG